MSGWTQEGEFPKKYRRFNILSFDDSGARSIIQATILHNLTSQFSKLLRDTDLLAGSGFGAICAFSLAAGMSPEEAEQAQRHAIQAATEPALDSTENLNSNGLRESLFSIFGDMRLGELGKKVVLPVIKATVPTPEISYNPLIRIIHSFSHTAGAEELIVDVAVEACMGIYSPRPPYVQKHLSSFPNPALVAIETALSRTGGKQPLENLCLLSIGGGKSPVLHEEQCPQFCAFDRQVDSLESEKFSIKLSRDFAEALLMEAAADVINKQCQQILGTRNRYGRINPQLKQWVPIEALTDSKPRVKEWYDLELAGIVAWLQDEWR